MASDCMKLCYLQVLSQTACDSPRFLRTGFGKKTQKSLTCKRFLCLPVRAEAIGLCVSKGRTPDQNSSPRAALQAPLQLQSGVVSAACPEIMHQIYELRHLEIFSMRTRQRK